MVLMWNVLPFALAGAGRDITWPAQAARVTAAPLGAALPQGNKLTGSGSLVAPAVTPAHTYNLLAPARGGGWRRQRLAAVGRATPCTALTLCAAKQGLLIVLSINCRRRKLLQLLHGAGWARGGPPAAAALPPAAALWYGDNAAAATGGGCAAAELRAPAQHGCGAWLGLCTYVQMLRSHRGDGLELGPAEHRTSMQGAREQRALARPGPLSARTAPPCTRQGLQSRNQPLNSGSPTSAATPTHQNGEEEAGGGGRCSGGGLQVISYESRRAAGRAATALLLALGSRGRAGCDQHEPSTTHCSSALPAGRASARATGVAAAAGRCRPPAPAA